MSEERGSESDQVRVSLPSPWQAWHCTNCEGAFATLLEEPELCPYCGEMDCAEAAEITLTGTSDAMKSFDETRKDMVEWR